VIDDVRVISQSLEALFAMLKSDSATGE
jgi:hypothetical protein